MDKTSLDTSRNDKNSYDSSNIFGFLSLVGGLRFGEAAFTQFVATCLLVALGLPLTIGAICGLYSQVRNGEVAPIYVINLLISDLVQFCCFIAEVAQPDWKIFRVFRLMYDYGLFASVGFMVCIALERYLVIVHPLWYRCRRTIKTSVLLCGLVWIFPVICVLTDRFSGDYRLTLVIFTILFLIPLPLLIFFLVATLKALSASISVPTEEKRRITGMLILVLLIYLLLFLPFIIMNVYPHSLGYNQHFHRLYSLAPVVLKLSPLRRLSSVYLNEERYRTPAFNLCVSLQKGEQ